MLSSEERPSLAEGGRASSMESAHHTRAQLQRASSSERGMGTRAISTLTSLSTMSDKQVVWSTNFYLFVFAYAMSFNAAVTSFDIQNFVLGRHVQSIGTGMLMTLIVVASLFSGTTAGVLGPKRVVSLACMLMLLYFIGFGAASLFEKEDPMQWPFFMIGAFGCGLAVALLMAGLGPWVDRTAILLCREDPELDFTEVSNKLLANFAAIASTVDVVFMLLLSGLKEFLHTSYSIVILSYGLLSLTAIAIMTLTRDPPADAGQEPKDCKKQRVGRLARQELSITLSYYQDPRALFLAVPPLTVGIFSAWKSFDIVNILEQPGSIGQDKAGIVNLVQAASTVLSSKLLERVIPCVGTNPIMALGTMLYIVAPLLFLFTGLAGNGYWILLFFIIAGTLWAVMETAFRVTLLDHFPGNMASAAFAAYTAQSFFGQAIFYFLSSIMSEKVGAMVKSITIVLLAVLIMPALYLADRRKDKFKAAMRDCKVTQLEDGSSVSS